jgi:hypothetical protein
MIINMSIDFLLDKINQVFYLFDKNIEMCSVA